MIIRDPNGVPIGLDETETTLTEVHKVTLFIVDHDRLGAKGVADALEHARYANRCISPRVMKVETEKVEWHDGHPLNQTATMRDYARAFFTHSKDE